MADHQVELRAVERPAQPRELPEPERGQRADALDVVTVAGPPELGPRGRRLLEHGDAPDLGDGTRRHRRGPPPPNRAGRAEDPGHSGPQRAGGPPRSAA